MLKYKKRSMFILLISSPVMLLAAGFVPEVYQDDYITVRSGIPDAGRKPINLGDRISLVIEAEFPADEVIIENLDEQLFERSWGAEKAISLIGPPVITRTETADNNTLIHSTYNFQVLDCPGELTSCRGNKVYELPIFTLGYQIVDMGGNVLNNKSVRFNPVPSFIIVMQALDIRGEGGLDELSAYLGNSGYPLAMNVPQDESASLWPVMSGGLLLLASFYPLLLTGHSTQRTDTRLKIDSRWERVLVRIKNDSEHISDEEWSDMLRRSVTWYSLDVLGDNPYEWLGDGVPTGQDRDVYEFFVDVLNQEGITKDKRQGFLDRFEIISSAPGNSRG